MKCDRIDRTGSCGLMLLKHQVNSRQIITEVRRKGVSHLLASGIQTPRISMGAVDSFKKIFSALFVWKHSVPSAVSVFVWLVGFNIYVF